MSRSDLFGITALLIPIAAVIAVPQAQLGALAVARKSPGGATSALVAPPAPEAGRAPSFIDVHYANESEEYATTLGIGDGTELELTGFVSESRSEEFVLTRFYVSCCAADALPYSVTVVAPDGSEYADNTWLRVAGVLEGEGEFKLRAESVREVQEPGNPYLY
ncbi:MAG: TIGR03943 family putative permease subunit [Actinomycetota bacterium]